MDVNATLAEIRHLVDWIENMDPPGSEDVTRLCELVGDLDNWLTGGGFLPSEWQRWKR